VNIYNTFAAVPQIENAAIALGTFDGMHLAHRHLVEKLCQGARTNNGNSMVISFLSPPKKTVAKNYNHGVLTTQSEKTEIFAEIGLNNLIITDFTTEISNMSYIDFIHFLRKKIDIKKIILGYNHHFGKNREGCYDTLLTLGKELHFDVERIEKQTINGLDISSSSVRHALSCGDIETANKILGYNYSICIQTLYDKNHDNHTIIFDQNKLLPKNGHYMVEIDGIKFSATIKQPHFTIEKMNNADGIYRVEFVGE
jgi:riboflavin kinase/FMN adenylyltransferase